MAAQGTVRISLRSMQQDGWPRPPGKIGDFLLPNSNKEEQYLLVKKTNDGTITVVATGQENNAVVLASFEHNAAQLVMTVFVNNCYIEPTSGYHARIPLRKSRPGDMHHLHMRNGDTIQFQDQAYNLKVTIFRESHTADQDNAATLAAQPAEVQVQSSLPARPTDHQDGNSTDDDIGGRDLEDGEQLFSTARGSAVGSQGVPIPGLNEEQSVQSLAGVAETPLKAVKTLDHIQALNAATTGVRQPVFTQNLPVRATTLPSIEPTPATLPQEPTLVVSPAPARRKKRSAPSTQVDNHNAKRARSLTSSPSVPRTILFSTSSFHGDKKMMAWLRTKHFDIIDTPSAAIDFVCVVGEGGLQLRTKLLHSLVLGKAVATDKWLEESKENDRVLPYDNYTHPELRASLEMDRSTVFQGHVIFVTAALQKKYCSQWTEISALLSAAGATSTAYGGAVKAKRNTTPTETLYIGSDTSDADARRIADDLKVVIYSKDLLWQSVLRGKLLAEDPIFQLPFDKNS